ncbi:hypothetical protein [Methylomonas sp. AM2-LC]|uniref:hypothetical protein n=1 Tax=Methylomonas sp. AM2-LC TaxID=3153301 RepID=UPI003267BADA
MDEIAIDGSFFKADTSKDSIYTTKITEKHLAELDKKIADYQQQLASQDAPMTKTALIAWLTIKKIERLKKQQAQEKDLQDRLKSSSNKRLKGLITTSFFPSKMKSSFGITEHFALGYTSLTEATMFIVSIYLISHLIIMFVNLLMADLYLSASDQIETGYPYFGLVSRL